MISSNFFLSRQKLAIDSSSSIMESSWFNQTSLINLDLRLQFPSPKGVLARQADEKISVKVETAADEVEALEVELDRVKEENKRLSETLAIMTKNYSILRTKLHEFTGANAKRKINADQSLDGYYSTAKSTEDNAGEHAECTSISDEQRTCKRARTADELQECNPKIYKLCVRTDPCDTTLYVPIRFEYLRWSKMGINGGNMGRR